MGCDIHLFTEVKIGGEWHCYSQGRIERNYELFSFMAGVRNHNNDIETLVEPKGVPDDLSKVVEMEFNYWGCDAHTPSWFDVDEIQDLEEFVRNQIKKQKEQFPNAPFDYPEKRWGYLCGNSFADFEKGAGGYSQEIEDVRFVFWFDN